MPNTAAATLIAERLPTGLPHPGDSAAGQQPFTITLPGMRSTGIPPEMAAQFASDAGLPSHNTPKLLGEAVVHLIETDGDSSIIANAELAQLRQDAADAPDGTRIIKVYDRRDRNVPTNKRRALLELTIGKTNEVFIDRGTVATALQAKAAS